MAERNIGEPVENVRMAQKEIKGGGGTAARKGVRKPGAGFRDRREGRKREYEKEKKKTLILDTTIKQTYHWLGGEVQPTRPQSQYLHPPLFGSLEFGLQSPSSSAG